MESSPSLSMCLLLLLFAYSFTTISLAQPRFKYCQSKCGNHSIDYPFGIDIADPDKPKCYLDGFQIRCINGTVPVLADADNVTVDEFNMAQGKVVLRRNTSLLAFNDKNRPPTETNTRVCLSLPSPFTISARSNKFMALGCNTLATITDDRSFNSSCRNHWSAGASATASSSFPRPPPTSATTS